FRVRAPHLVVAATPTPLAELRFFKNQSSNSELKSAATRALASFKGVWGFHPVSLTPTQRDRVERIADQLRAINILPSEERHDSFILVEAALISAKLLVTEDAVLRGVDYSRLVFELSEWNL